MHKITTIKCGFGNCFCIEENGNALLIDCSVTQYKNKVLDVCKNKNVRLIILTHGHVDHIQNALDVSKVLNVPIAMNMEDYGLIRNAMDQKLFARNLGGKLFLAVSVMSLKHSKIKPFEPDIFLNNGDSLDSYGIGARIIGLPGHTKGSIGVLVNDSDFFVGDALMNILYPSKPLIYGDELKMHKSAERIGAFKSATVHFGHGKSVANRYW